MFSIQGRADGPALEGASSKRSVSVAFRPLAAPHKNSALAWTAAGSGGWWTGTPAGVGGRGTLAQLAAWR